MTKASRLLQGLFALGWAGTALSLVVHWVNGTPPDGFLIVAAVAAALTLAWDRLGVAVSGRKSPSS